MKEQLKKFLKDGDPWEKMATDTHGLFIVKVPGPKKSPEKGRLMLEVIPVDENNKPRKRKGLYLSDKETFIQYFDLLNDDNITKILMTIEEVNPVKQNKPLKKLKME
ncbi:MAG: hypothetical protein ACTSRE_10535 [Promethearchaeota archaeon]